MPSLFGLSLACATVVGPLVRLSNLLAISLRANVKLD